MRKPDIPNQTGKPSIIIPFPDDIPVGTADSGDLSTPSSSSLFSSPSPMFERQAVQFSDQRLGQQTTPSPSGGILRKSGSISPNRAPGLKVHFKDMESSDRSVGEQPPSAASLSLWNMACESKLGKWGILILFFGLVGLLFASYGAPFFYIASAAAVTGIVMYGASFFFAKRNVKNEPVIQNAAHCDYK